MYKVNIIRYYGLCAFTFISTLLQGFPMAIDHVIITAAGHGTRFLPYTKVTCKELVPLIDVPIIHHVVEEAILSGSTAINIVINERKQAVKDYFTHNEQLKMMLHSVQRDYMIASLEKLIDAATFNFFNQKEQQGSGHAILQAITPAMYHDFFSIIYPDDIIFGDIPALAQLMTIAREHHASVIAVTEVPLEKVSAYGIIQPHHWINDDLCEIARIVEKPTIADAPSRLAIIGRFVVSPGCITAMQYCAQRDGDTFLFPAALEHLAKTEKVYAYRIQGTRHDTGTPEGWLGAVIDYAARTPRYAHIVNRAAIPQALLRTTACGESITSS